MYLTGKAAYDTHTAPFLRCFVVAVDVLCSAQAFRFVIFVLLFILTLLTYLPLQA